MADEPGSMRERPGEIMGFLAYAHPFLDGNGRTIMVVHTELAQRAGVSIAWDATDKDAYLGSADTRAAKARARPSRRVPETIHSARRSAAKALVPTRRRARTDLTARASPPRRAMRFREISTIRLASALSATRGTARAKLQRAAGRSSRTESQGRRVGQGPRTLIPPPGCPAAGFPPTADERGMPTCQHVGTVKRG